MDRLDHPHLSLQGNERVAPASAAPVSTSSPEPTIRPGAGSVQVLTQHRCVDLATAVRTLARSRRAKAALRAHLGGRMPPDAVRRMHEGDFEGDLGAAIEGFFRGEIASGHRRAWSGLRGQQPVDVCAYEGVFYVVAGGQGPVGYFLSLGDAKDYATRASADRPPAARVRG